MALAFPEEEWRHVTPAQIDCFGEYVEPRDCGVSAPGKTFHSKGKKLRNFKSYRSGVLSLPWILEPGTTDRR